MKKRYLYILILLGIAAVLWIRIPAVVLRTPAAGQGKTFSGTPVGDEYAWNRDGSIVKISDRLAVMKLNGEEDRLIYVKDPTSPDFRWVTLDRAEIVSWRQEEGRLILTVSENGAESERVYEADSLIPPED